MFSGIPQKQGARDFADAPGMVSAGYQIIVGLKGCHARWLYGMTLAQSAYTVYYYIKDSSRMAILYICFVCLRKHVFHFCGHSDSFWVTVLSAWGWEEGRTGCVLAALQAWSSILQPAP